MLSGFVTSVLSCLVLLLIAMPIAVAQTVSPSSDAAVSAVSTALARHTIHSNSHR